MRSLHVVFGLPVVFAIAAVACGDPELVFPLPVDGNGGANVSASTATTAAGLLFDGGTGAGDGACAEETTCAKKGATCGEILDGCGGILQCGTCAAPKTCGGDGLPNACGGKGTCVPKTCAGLSTNCGPVGDGCGNVVQCGDCTMPETCGGGGTASVCGMGTVCMPKTCAQLNVGCGPAGDGCGNQLDCGGCVLPQLCGGGGVASQCGAPACKPRVCVAGTDCGPLGDGCGNLLQCGGCTLPETCGGAAPSVCGVSPLCTGLCLQQTSCPNNGATTVSGIVYAPGHAGDPAIPLPGSPDPLFNMLVYVPNAPVLPFTPGVACEQCTASVSGSPLVSTFTDTAGKFTLTNVPVGQNIPLVIQNGRWRRQIVIPTVTACQDNPLAATDTRLPRNQGEGDIPHMAFATGAVDSLECVLRKIGVDDAEFTQPTATGRIHFYTGVGAAGANAGPGTPDESTLWGTAAVLDQYDMVLFPCQGAEYDKTAAQQQNVIDYASAGGRIFTTHFSYVWLYNDTPFSTTANWQVGQGTPADQTGFIDQTFPKGQALAQWLLNVVTPVQTLGQIPINVLRHDFNGVVAPSQSWMTITNPAASMHYTFNAPVNAAADQQCGRVLFDDFHVEDAEKKQTTGKIFPTECTPGPMTPQEKLLEFMLFDLGSCITPDIPMCTPQTCLELGVQCGPAGDGCGNVLQCGTCPAGQTCGGGGVPSVCGAPQCTPESCTDQSINCGPAGDGCGNLLQCGNCPPGQTCGGGGKAGVCGNMLCTPKTCMDQGLQCGPAGDGCGNLIQCGTCPANETCGGGGTPGVCGMPVCTPKTCLQLGDNCGPAADGCGNLVQCGNCVAPATCGGGGKANTCGGGIH